MNKETLMHSISYEITALVLRYILVLLCAIVFIRSIFISRASQMLYSNNKISIAKLISRDTNNEFYLGYDNIIGTSNRCDVKVFGKGIAKIHIQIYKKKDNWMLCTYTKKLTILNEIKIGGRIQISTNDIIKLGTKEYKFVLLEGKKT